MVSSAAEFHALLLQYTYVVYSIRMSQSLINVILHILIIRQVAEKELNDEMVDRLIDNCGG